MAPVLSVFQGDNDALIAEVARLWLKPTDRVIDVTYGEGMFWRIYRPKKLVKHDLFKLDGVDLRHLPHRAGSFDVLVLDPAYVSTGGRETSNIDEFNEAYGMLEAPRTPEELDVLFDDGIKEAHRVLRKGGPHNGRSRLLVKCADYVSGGHYHQGRHNVVLSAEWYGFEQVDEFIHFSGTGPQPKNNPDGTVRRQVHSRRAHSILCVFELKG